MAAKVQLTPEQIAELREMHARGVSRNDCADHFGVARMTMTRLSARLEPPISWDQREYLRAAVEHRALTAAEKRAELAAASLDEAAALVADIRKPQTIVQLGTGSDGGSEWFERKISKPSPRDQKDLAQAASILANMILKLKEFDAPKPDAESLGPLGAFLADGLGRAYTAIQEEREQEDVDG